jgi:3-methyladenine DNA glycosylase AlkC
VCSHAASSAGRRPRLRHRQASHRHHLREIAGHCTDPALPLGFVHLINLMTDPKEHEPINQAYYHSWTMHR